MPIEIPLTRGYVALIDEADEELVRGRHWRAALFRKGIVYAFTRMKKEDGSRWIVGMHRLIAGAGKGEVVDHIDHDGLNNTRANLRVVRQTQNIRNSRRELRMANNRTGFVGVRCLDSVTRGPRYHGVVFVSGKFIRTPTYSAAEDAARARDLLALRHYGQFTTLNFPELRDGPFFCSSTHENISRHERLPALRRGFSEAAP